MDYKSMAHEDRRVEIETILDEARDWKVEAVCWALAIAIIGAFLGLGWAACGWIEQMIYKGVLR